MRRPAQSRPSTFRPGLRPRRTSRSTRRLATSGRVLSTPRRASYHHRCWVIVHCSLLEPGMVDRMDPRGKIDRWRHWLAPDSGFVTMVADESGTPVGHTTVSGQKMVHLFVDPDYWGQGLGRRL